MYVVIICSVKSSQHSVAYLPPNLPASYPSDGVCRRLLWLRVPAAPGVGHHHPRPYPHEALQVLGGVVKGEPVHHAVPKLRECLRLLQVLCVGGLTSVSSMYVQGCTWFSIMVIIIKL